MFFSLLALCCAIGLALLTTQLDLPLPGAIVVMACYAVVLWQVKRLMPATLAAKINKGLQHLSLLFIPAGIWVLFQTQLLANEWLSLLLVVIVSTAITQWLLIMLIKALKLSEEEHD